MAVTQDFQAELEGTLLMGNGTYYDIMIVQGLGGMPGVHTTDVLRLGDHGAYLIARDLVNSKVVNIGVQVIGTDATDLDTKIKAWRALWVPSDTVKTLKFKFKAFGYGDQIYMIRGSARRCAMDLGAEANFGVQTVYGSLECQDPRVYADTLHSTAIAPSATTNLTNAGVLTAPLTVSVNGPATTVTLTNNTTSEVWTGTFSVSSGQTLEIDMLARTVTKAGVSQRQSVNNATTTWFGLRPGVNSITAVGGTSPGSTFTWRDTYL